MVAGIIQTHGGRVEIRSQPWQGTEIEIFLGGDGARSEPTLPAEHGAAPAPALAGRRILVVEDEAHLRDLLAELFTTRGAMVTAAEHGEEGWQRLNAGTFDLVISDQQMPHLTGLELLARLRERDTELPVILVSGYGLEGVVEDRVRDPKLRILSKPFSFNRLLAVVGELL
jgi:CheY-like chemotaxis protein